MRCLLRLYNEFHVWPPQGLWERHFDETSIAKLSSSWCTHNLGKWDQSANEEVTLCVKIVLCIFIGLSLLELPHEKIWWVIVDKSLCLLRSFTMLDKYELPCTITHHNSLKLFNKQIWIALYNNTSQFFEIVHYAWQIWNCLVCQRIFKS